MGQGIERLSRALDRLCRWGALAGIVAMVVLIGVQVVARYVLNDPPIWTEEAARYAMVWAGLLGATAAFRERSDPVLMTIAPFRTRPGRVVAEALRAIATVVFLGPIWYHSVFGPNFDLARGYVGRSSMRAAEAIGLSMSWFTVALPIAITVIFVHLAAALVGRGPTGPAPAPAEAI